MIPNIEQEEEQRQTSEILESVIKWSLRIIGAGLAVFILWLFNTIM
jgi:hypothetical protein